MRWARKFTATATATLAVPAAIATALAFGPAGAQAATSTLCNSQTEAVAGGAYTVQNNEWGSGASECITTDGNADFSVANSSIDNATNGAPGGYPSLYKGCHWGACTSGSGLPIPVSSMTTGAVTTSWNTTQPGTGAYDVAYDIWFNTTPTTSGQPNGAELMIWLNHNGSVQPFGSQVGTATVGGRGYNVWFGNQGWNTISYTMTTGTTSVTNLDIDQIVADAISRGYIQPSWYLIDVEAGFELWQGGAGLATNSFAVNVNGSGSGGTGGGGTGGGGTPPPSTGCTAAYSVVNSWSGGFQAQVTVTNTGTSSLSGWQLAWTFPGDQKINSLWNGSYTQSGPQIGVTPAAYNGSIAPGSSVTVGFTATDTTGSAPPSSVTCS
ncbi:MAG TPA: cellulose binding domain-containing protein [Streptosporangiaceae bacterium]|nr:cellulose binding domain-containing protein [Streptosporangiaceae bacterium]